MRIVITGGNGYVGSRLCKDLAEAGNEVIPVCRGIEQSTYANHWISLMYEVIYGDIRDDLIIDQICELKPDVIIHLVSLNHHDSENDPKFVSDVNVLPCWKLLKKFTRHGLKKFIYLSTMQVYGKIPNTTITEAYTPNPINSYGLTHLMCENICKFFNKTTNTNVIIVRLSNSYGHPLFVENKCWWLAINDICRGAFVNKEIRLLSDGSPQRDFIHGFDVSQAIKLLVKTEVKENENIYHLCSGITLTLIELAQSIKQEYKNKYNIDLPIYTSNGIYNEKNNTSIEKFNFTNSKLSTIGFSPKYTLDSGINDLFTYLENIEQ